MIWSQQNVSEPVSFEKSKVKYSLNDLVLNKNQKYKSS